MGAESTQWILDIQARFGTLGGATSALTGVNAQLGKARDNMKAFEKPGANLKGDFGGVMKDMASAEKKAADHAKQFDGIQKSINDKLAARTRFKQDFADKMAEGARQDAIAQTEMLTTAAGGAAVAILAIEAAAAKAALSLASFALSGADAARSSYLLSAASAGSAAGGAQLEAVVSQLARRVPLARDQIAGMARDIEDVKLSGRAAQAALTAMSVVASARGQGAASAIKGIAEQSKNARRFLLGARDIYGEFTGLSGTGIKAADIYQALSESMKVSIPQAKAMLAAGKVSVKDGMIALEKAAQGRFGHIVGDQMISLTTQIAKAKENFAGLFSGAYLENFLKGLSTITGLLSQDTFTGHALKEVLSGAMGDFLNGASKVFPYVRAGLIGVAIGALTVYLYILRARNALSDFAKKLGLSDKLKGIDGLKLALYAGIGIVGLLTTGFVLLAVAITLALVPLALLAVAILVAVLAPVAIIYGLGLAFDWLKSKVVAFVSGLAADAGRLFTIGQDYVTGLINGIKAKIPELTDIAKTVGGVLLGGVGQALLIHSPSRKGFQQGSYYGQGIALGAEHEAPRLEAAGSRAADALMTGGGSAGVDASGGGKHYHWHQHAPVYGIDNLERLFHEFVDKAAHREAAALP